MSDRSNEAEIYTNHLIDETSPYLLQHAHNPVEWYPWSDEAFEIAEKEDKPVLVSIGYAACHWCHVMEHESFEDTAVAGFMNEHFVNIKVDREERPDIDQIYMEAVQTMTGSGGWPLNVFLTPEGKPFYGGTYFPPGPGVGRPSWLKVLKNISRSWKEKRAEIEEQAEKLTNHIKQNDQSFISRLSDKELMQDSILSEEAANIVYEQLEKEFDTRHGGFGNAPKFPSTMSLKFLLRYYHFTGNKEALTHVLLSLDKMSMGGLYDQLGGGFARYATDNKWQVPHFEKMLYDNALLISLYSEAYQITGKEQYKEVIEETLKFTDREMTSKDGGFYSSLDADSEGEEGKYYVWDKQEIYDILDKESADLFTDYYNVRAMGNWEGVNILNRQSYYETYSSGKGISEEELKIKLKKARAKLLKHRESRVRPGLDDKVLLSWNALMASAYVNAYKSLKEEQYKNKAIRNINFLLKQFRKDEGRQELYHTYKEGIVKYPAFLDDYAYLIKALLDLYEVSYNEELLIQADMLTGYVIDKFYDKNKFSFYFTSSQQEDVILRKKDLFDNSTPSGNSVMADNLYRLGIIMNNEKYRKISFKMMERIEPAVKKIPLSLSEWANVLLNYVYPVWEIAITGPDSKEKADEIMNFYIPNKIMMVSDKQNNNFTLLKNRYNPAKTLIYVCQDYTCKKPVSKVEEFKTLVNID